MTIRVALVVAVLGGVAWAAGGATDEPVIDPKADAQLKKMSEYLDGLGSFRVDTTNVIEKVTTDGHKIQEIKDSQLMVKRPNKLRVDRVGPRGSAVFRYDGKQVSVFAPDHNVYAMAPAPADLEGAIDQARDRYNVDAPGGDLLVPNSYLALTRDIKTGHYVGLEPIGGQMAHHLAMTSKDVDWQLWIADGPKPVPLRYVIVTRDMASQPEFTLETRNWRSDPSIADAQFDFTPPPKAMRVEFTGEKKASPKP